MAVHDAPLRGRRPGLVPRPQPALRFAQSQAPGPVAPPGPGLVPRPQPRPGSLRASRPRIARRRNPASAIHGYSRKTVGIHASPAPGAAPPARPAVRARPSSYLVVAAGPARPWSLTAAAVSPGNRAWAIHGPRQHFLPAIGASPARRFAGGAPAAQVARLTAQAFPRRRLRGSAPVPGFGPFRGRPARPPAALRARSRPGGGRGTTAQARSASGAPERPPKPKRGPAPAPRAASVPLFRLALGSAVPSRGEPTRPLSPRVAVWWRRGARRPGPRFAGSARPAGPARGGAVPCVAVAFSRPHGSRTPKIRFDGFCAKVAAAAARPPRPHPLMPFLCHGAQPAVKGLRSAPINGPAVWERG